MALQTGDEQLKKRAIDFLEVCDSDWSSEISTFALQTLHSRQFNKPKRIPLAKDLQKLNAHMEKKAKSLHDTLKSEKGPDMTTWRELNEVTLAQLVLFNRRRGGETERIELSQYQNGIKTGKTLQEDIVEGLSSRVI